MRQASTVTTLAGIGIANGILIGAALATTRPLHYLLLAAGVGTFINMTFLFAGRLWARQD